ncbi:MAG: hypothetical protein HC850_13535, partial [Rhodomicrobium sp.]|nr:hypothetical protein [Rhodomicrobium sp.]
MRCSNRLVGALLAGAMMTAHGVPAFAGQAIEGRVAPQVDGAGKEAQSDEDDAIGSEGIVVTGSRIRGAQGTGTVITLDRTIIEETGVVDLGEALRQLP